jgi:hypothetical protein
MPKARRDYGNMFQRLCFLPLSGGQHDDDVLVGGAAILGVSNIPYYFGTGGADDTSV